MSDVFERQPGLTDLEFSMQETAHRFAKDIMRPAGQTIDRMDPELAFAKDSPYWEARKQFCDLGLHLGELVGEVTPMEFSRINGLITEELGWGDYGLAGSFFAASFPAHLAMMSGRPELMERFHSNQIGCWGLTEPGHGSDQIDYSQAISPHARGGEASDCVAVRKGDKLIIKGQKSAWISNGYIADVMSLFCRYDDGDNKNGRAAILVPLDLPGITRGKNIYKLGLRALPDSEIYFDDVEVPFENLVFGPEQYPHVLHGILSGGSGPVGALNTGLARAAYELALNYSKERVQGGEPIFKHKNIRIKLATMFQKITASRALYRHVMEQNVYNPELSYSVSSAAKTMCVETAIDVTGLAFEVFGGAAVVFESGIEKLLRDARTGSIGEGQNDMVRLLASLDL